MKKIANFILWASGLLGTYLVTEGLATGEEISNIQNVIGMALAGGSVTFGTVIAILRAMPKQLVTAGYDKAVEKYGQAKVDGVFNKFDEFLDLLHKVDNKLDNVESLLVEAKEFREDLTSE